MKDLRLVYSIAILHYTFTLAYRLFLLLIIDPILFVSFSLEDLRSYCCFMLFAFRGGFRVLCVFIISNYSYLSVWRIFIRSFCSFTSILRFSFGGLVMIAILLYFCGGNFARLFV